MHEYKYTFEYVLGLSPTQFNFAIAILNYRGRMEQEAMRKARKNG
jgi:hypothetical protein